MPSHSFFIIQPCMLQYVEKSWLPIPPLYLLTNPIGQGNWYTPTKKTTKKTPPKHPPNKGNQYHCFKQIQFTQHNVIKKIEHRLNGTFVVWFIANYPLNSLRKRCLANTSRATLPQELTKYITKLLTYDRRNKHKSPAFSCLPFFTI